MFFLILAEFAAVIFIIKYLPENAGELLRIFLIHADGRTGGVRREIIETNILHNFHSGIGQENTHSRNPQKTAVN